MLRTAHDLLLKLVRLDEGTPDHWPTPSRALEKDLSAASYDRYLTCTSSAEARVLAGELFQKVTTYGLRLALVVPAPAVYGPRWADLAFEHANHRVIRFVPTRADTEAWVSG